MTRDIHYGRKRSGIVKELQEKVEDWLTSIPDEVLRDRIRDNTIVTGGSIASMLLGEGVNDFDIYFRDRQTTLMVAEYYASVANNEFDRGVTVDTQTKKNLHGDMEERVIINVPSSGIVDREEEARISKTEEATKKPYHIQFMSENAITLSDSVQLVTRFYGSPDEIHSNYDFVHAKSYWDHARKDLVIPAEAMESMLCRTLHYTGSLYPIASIFRMKKFIERGWRISAGQQLKIMWQISEINLKDPVVLREQLTGVDQLYMLELMNALEKVDANRIDSTYVGDVIDKIF